MLHFLRYFLEDIYCLLSPTQPSLALIAQAALLERSAAESTHLVAAADEKTREAAAQISALRIALAESEAGTKRDTENREVCVIFAAANIPDRARQITYKSVLVGFALKISESARPCRHARSLRSCAD
jgi:hypothetical protein